METLNHILASFDLTSVFSALFPAVAASFEKAFILIYNSLFSWIVEIIEKMPLLIPVAGFLALYAATAFLMNLRRKAIRVRK